MTFRIERSSNAQYYFDIVAGNGKILAHSETYIEKSSAEHAIDLIKSGASWAQTIDES